MRTRADCRPSRTTRAPAGAGVGLPDGAPPDWGRVEFAPLPELTDVIRPGGLANQKAPRLQATLRKIREERGDYSLEFLGDMSALEARDWLTRSTGSARRPPRSCCCSASASRCSRSTGTWSGSPGGWACCRQGDARRGPRPVPRGVAARRDVRGAREPDPARPEGLSRPAPRPRRVPASRAVPLRRPEGALGQLAPAPHRR